MSSKDDPEKGDIGAKLLPASEISPVDTTCGTSHSFLWFNRSYFRVSFGGFRKYVREACLKAASTLRQSAVGDSRQPVVRKLEECPPGFPNLAAFLDSDENFMLYRRFGFLQARILLDKQDELRVLEKSLDEMDKLTFRNEPYKLRTTDLEEEDAKPRKVMLQKIEKTFCEYARVLCAAQQMMSFNKPAAGEYKSVEAYINNEKPLEQAEGSYIYRKEDFITLRAGRDHAWLDSSIEKLLKVFHCRLVEYVFCSKETRQKSQGVEVYYNRERIEAFVVTIITLMIIALLMLPIYMLYNLSSSIGDHKAVAIHLGILLVFTLAFSATLSLFTRAKRHEILAASAAYCAVLVVFLGNINSNAPP